MYLKMIEDRDLNKIEGGLYTIKKSKFENFSAIILKTAIFFKKII